MSMAALIDVSDGLVRIQSRGSATSAVIFSDNKTSGRISYDEERQWPETGDVRLRCDFPGQLRASGNAGRALRLLLHHLATRTRYRTAVLLVREADADLLALVAGAGFAWRASLDGHCLFTGPVPPVTYTDGVVTIRPLRADDIDRHMEAIDDEQIDWLWDPDHRATWKTMTPVQQREHNAAYLRACQDGFGNGPKWAFSADLADASYVAYVDCDLANCSDVPRGDANISYTGHPAYRGQGNVSSAVRLVASFLRDHTGAGSAHIIVDEANEPSLRVARAVGATRAGRWIDEHGRPMIRHVLPLR